MSLRMGFYDLKQVYLVYKNCGCETCFPKGIFVFNKMTRLYPLKEGARGIQHFILTLIKGKTCFLLPSHASEDQILFSPYWCYEKV